MAVRKKVLDLGSGGSKIKGSIGIDILDLPGVDIVHDLESFPYPIEDSSFDKVVSFNCLEHIDNLIGLIREVYRVLKPGGTFHFEVPHFSSCDMYTDPTHKSFFSYRSVDYYVNDGNMLNNFKYLEDVDFLLIKRNITFWGSKKVFDKPQEFVFNKIPGFYERKLAWMFPAHQLVFELKSLKSK
jgi:SAM-dependent methyltransferase